MREKLFVNEGDFNIKVSSWEGLVWFGQVGETLQWSHSTHHGQNPIQGLG